MDVPLTMSGVGSDVLTRPFLLKRGLVRFKGNYQGDDSFSALLQNMSGGNTGQYVLVHKTESESFEWAISSDGEYRFKVTHGKGPWTIEIQTWRALCVDLILNKLWTAADCDGLGGKVVIGHAD